jgi:NADH-quinone oxidoreductase subunit A
VNELRGPGFGKLLQEKPASPTLPQQLTAPAKEKFSDLGIPPTCIEATEKIQPSKMLSASNATEKTLQDDLSSLALMALLDIGVFFVVLLVGFAFLWKQGDLNWVRAIARPATKPQIKLAVLPNTREAQ